MEGNPNQGGGGDGGFASLASWTGMTAARPTRSLAGFLEFLFLVPEESSLLGGGSLHP